MREQGGSRTVAQIQRRVQIVTQIVDAMDGTGGKNAMEAVAPSPHQDPAPPLTHDQHQDPAPPLTHDQHQDLHLRAIRQTQLGTGT